MTSEPIAYRCACSLLFLVTLALEAGCAGYTVVLPNPPEATVRLGGQQLPSNALKYGRWVGNSYDLDVSAPGFKTRRIVASPDLGNRAVAVTIVCAASILGIPLIPFILPWNGEIDDRIYVSLEPVQP